VDWQPWNSSATHLPLLTFLDPEPNVTITHDTYRADAMALLNELIVEFAAAQRQS